ncbi:MAG: PAS domain S-box protein, partial [Planctomycetaceae bacterium]|nr:PAS domain S-box protein [Planctomycetaceae bacterium]
MSDILLGHVMMSSLDVLLVIDEKGIIQLVSRSIDRVFGWTPDELVGKNVSCLMPEPHGSKHDSYLDAYRETGETTILGQTREFDAMRKDGSLFPCELTVWTVELPDQQGPAFSGFIRDISARRKLEQERHNYIDRLEQTQRTLELQAEELRNAQEAAEAASRAKSWFLAKMSHEIRTPMTAIIGYAELMQETLSDEFDVESAETIVRNGKHLLTLINEILDLSK